MKNGFNVVLAAACLASFGGAAMAQTACGDRDKQAS